MLQMRTWTGTTSITLFQHISGQRKAQIQLTEAAERAPADVPNSRQRVTYLLDLIKTEYTADCMVYHKQDYWPKNN